MCVHVCACGCRNRSCDPHLQGATPPPKVIEILSGNSAVWVCVSNPELLGRGTVQCDVVRGAGVKRWSKTNPDSVLRDISGYLQ